MQLTPTIESSQRFVQDSVGWGMSLWNQYAHPTISAAIIVFVMVVAAKWTKRLILSACARGGLDVTIGHFFVKLVGWGLVLVAGILVLSSFGIDTASFTVILGTVGIAIGLAFQSTLSNFAAGVMLMIFRPYKIGDSIVVAGQTGVVNEIDLFSTTLDTVDRRRIFIPNNSIFGSVITNTSTHETRRADVNVRVDFRADIDTTQRVLLAAALATPGLTDEAPEVGLLELGATGVDWQVRVWCKGVDYPVVRGALVRAVKTALDAAGIAVAVQVVDVRVMGNTSSLP
ncbi:MAG: mechanosensitive ion channel family protein [Phycisphaerales bacterium]|nr:mechanosensitive ion channel family protein [Phycisphaerales bacterium]